MFRTGRVFTMVALGLFFALGKASAGVSPDLKCKDLKAKATGKQAFSVLKALTKNKKKTDLTKLAGDISKAQSKFTKSFTKIEDQGGCATTGDANALQVSVNDYVAEVIDQLCPTTSTTNTTNTTLTTVTTTTSTTTTTICGKLPATGQLLCWDSSGVLTACGGTGHDGELQAGGPLSYVDNGDGTISDLNTGLMWAKKSDDGSIHDKDNVYNWDDAVGVHIAGLNSAVFAGYSDWRLANYKELATILDLSTFLPAVDSVFDTGCVPACTVAVCSCTASAGYWSSTTTVGTPGSAWQVFFSEGATSGTSKANPRAVRAVRGMP